MHFGLEINLKIRAGYDIAFECYQDVSMVLLLSVHPSREAAQAATGKVKSPQPN